jgi:hypothetical protein
MARTNAIQTNFLSGELSPILFGRVDTDRYTSGVETCENFIIKLHGGVERRGGTHYVAAVKDSTKKARLIRFEFNRAQSYVLEFGESYIRFFTQNGQVVSGGSAYEISSPYTEAQLDEIQVAQSADTMYIVHPDVAPRKLVRTSNTSWALTAPSFTAPKWDATDKYPRSVTFHQQRLWFGGTEGKPQTIFASKSDDFENFTLGVNDDDALEYQIASYKVNTVEWMSSTEVLLVGTSGGEFKVTGGNAPLTPSNVQVTRQTSYGGKNIQPRHIGYQTLFVQGTGRSIRSYEYSWTNDSYDSEDLTFLANHIGDEGIKQMAYQMAPDSILWCVLDNGVLAGMTYDKNRSIVGWHRHTTDGTFESLAVIPQSTVDQVWVISKRTIGGVTKRYVEYLDPDLHVDSALTYSGSAITGITSGGLAHLEGKTVSILGDDAVVPNATVSSGNVSFGGASVTKADIGLPFTSTLKTLAVEGGNPAGTAQGLQKRWNEIYVRLHDSFFPKINGIRPPVRSPATGMGTAEPKTTGDVRVRNEGVDLDGQVTITQDLPGPTHLLSIFGTLSVNGG